MQHPVGNFCGSARAALRHPLVSRLAKAEAYPVRPVRIVVGFAGGPQRMQICKRRIRNRPRISSVFCSWPCFALRTSQVGCCQLARMICRSRASPRSVVASRRMVLARIRDARSALAVAHPGADHAILAAKAVALLERGVLRSPQPGRCGIAERTASIRIVDCECRATARERRNHLAVAARAFAHCRRPRRLGLREVVGIAKSAALSDRERTGRLRRGDADEQKGRRAEQASYERKLPRA